MLDSGAYTASRNPNVKLDIDEYIEFIRQHGDIFDYCINLDVIGNDESSYKNWKYIRQQGIDVLPVFHMGTDEKWLQKYLRQADYIGLGAVANVSTDQRISGLTRIWIQHLLDSKGMPKAKIHALGLTATNVLLRFPWYSVDSSSPNLMAGFGKITLPKIIKENGEKIISYYDSIQVKVSDQAEQASGGLNLVVPSTRQQLCLEYIRENGFELGEIAYQEKREKRAKRLRRPPAPPALFSVTKPPDPDADNTLANNFMVRYKWNLREWEKLIERLPNYPRKFAPMTLPEEKVREGDKTNVYIVISPSKAYLDASAESTLNILASYMYFRTSADKVQILKDYKR